MQEPTKSQLQAAAKALGVSASGNKADIQARITQFGYHAIVDKGRRQAPQVRVKHEGKILPPSKRNKLISTTQDQARNASLVAWMVRKHLDYVARFHPEVNTKKPKVKKVVERLLRWHANPKNFDVSGRLGREEFFRLYELEKVTAGDSAFIKINKLKKLQAIESDMIAKPKDFIKKGDRERSDETFQTISDSGFIKGDSGEVIKYCICNRGERGTEVVFDHLEDAANVEFDAYYSRFSSQDRGVSPLSSAINIIQDVYEGMEWNLIKAKMHAIFGVAILRNAGSDESLGGSSGVALELDGDTAAAASDSHLDLKPDMINLLDLDSSDDLKIIESGTPSTEFISAMNLYIQIAMLALDIPVTCFDSRKSSFSARIADLNEYEVSTSSKQDKNRYKREAYSDWLVEVTWNDKNSRFRLRDVCEAAGVTMTDVQEMIEWIPSGAPWLDKFKQIMGDRLAIDTGIDNAIDISRRRGTDVFRNIDKQSEVIKYAKRKGVPIMTGGSGVRSAGEILAEEQQREREAEEIGGDE